MNNSTWHFRKKRPSDTARDPISSEFFSDESVDNSASALARESIQNSLDARNRESQVATEVRLYLGTGAYRASPSAIAPFFSDAWTHLAAPGNGLGSRPGPREPCGFLTIEDFGTTGLEGDPLQWKPSTSLSNAFYAFFRAEAYSEKTGDDKGRWGVGKLVFPRASRASAFFGLTITKSQPRALLMGRMILRHHDVAGITYVPDAAFGVSQELQADPDFVTPSDDAELVRAFSSTFGISRRSEPGLSIVVPWLDEEDAFEPHAMTRTIATEYFLPILKGQLIVRIRHGDKTIVLDRASLEKPGQPWIDESLAQILSLGRAAAQSIDAQLIDVASPDQRYSVKWPEHALTAEEAAIVRGLLEQGETLGFRIPVRVDRKEGGPQLSEFSVYLRAAESGTSVRPVFIRDGIRITSAKGKQLPGFTSLVTIDDGALATLLGDSENPAHTEWRPQTRGFKDKYKNAPSYLEFVRGAPLNVFSTVFRAESEDDPFALSKFFPETSNERDPRGHGTRKKPKQPGGGGHVPPPDIVRKPRRVGLRRVPGGFEISRGAPGAPTPEQLRIRAAYDVRRGEAFSRYDPLDFKIEDMEIEHDGVELRHVSANEVVLAIVAEDFRLRVTGFDAHRDLKVRVDVQEKTDDR